MENNETGRETLSDDESFDFSQIPCQVINSDHPIARLYSKNRFEYLINKTRVTVGRSSDKEDSEKIDVNLCGSLYVSRVHFEIFTTDCTNFSVVVHSKNGLFVNGVFHRKGQFPVHLPPTCRMRFPKTDIKILFQVLQKEDVNADESKLCSDEPIEDLVTASAVEQLLLHQAASLPPSIILSPKRPSQMYTPDSDVDERPAIKVEKPAVKRRKTKEFEVERDRSERPKEGRDGKKPPYSYSQLIIQAIISTPDHQLSLSDIYNYIVKTYPYYRFEDKGWQNSIRHNLSLNSSFVRVPRGQEDAGKGAFWRIAQADEYKLSQSAFKPRGVNREKVTSYRSHQREHVSSIGTSDESLDAGDHNEDEEAVNNITSAMSDYQSEFKQEAELKYEPDDQSMNQFEGTQPEATFLGNPMQAGMQPAIMLEPQLAVQPQIIQAPSIQATIIQSPTIKIISQSSLQMAAPSSIQFKQNPGNPTQRIVFFRPANQTSITTVGSVQQRAAGNAFARPPGTQFIRLITGNVPLASLQQNVLSIANSAACEETDNQFTALNDSLASDTDGEMFSSTEN